MFTATVLRRHDVKYFYCVNCGLTRTEDPYWLEEAYRDAVAVADTGLVQRNLMVANKLSILLYHGFDPHGRYADIAGGYGMLVRLMRDIGFDFYWEDKYCRNEFARGFEVGQTASPFTALTAFEVLEHLADPVAWLSEKMRVYGSRTLIFSTETYSGSRPPEPSWWYYSFNTGQHVSFYQTRTLQTIADRMGVRYWKLAGLHVFTCAPPKTLLILRALPGRLIFPLALYVRSRMLPRTVRDHQALLNQAPSTIRE